MKKHSKLQWSDEATEYFKKVPPFVRPMARKSVEQFARNHDHSVITPEIIRNAREKMAGVMMAKTKTRQTTGENLTGRPRPCMHLTATGLPAKALIPCDMLFQKKRLYMQGPVASIWIPIRLLTPGKNWPPRRTLIPAGQRTSIFRFAEAIADSVGSTCTVKINAFQRNIQMPCLLK